MMRRIIILAFAFIIFFNIKPADAQPLKAKTEDGKEVILYTDGTWQHVITQQESPSSITKSQESKKSVKGQRKSYSISFDEKKWRIADVKFNSSAEFCFTHTAGDAYAMIIEEVIQLPVDRLKETLLENAKRSATDAQIIFEEKRILNNKEVLYMKIKGTVQSIPFIYFGCYYTGKSGTIQVTTFTTQDLFDKFESDFIDFMNGFEISESAREIMFADGSKYLGLISNGKMHGPGTYIWPNGDKYTGEFIDNRATGGFLHRPDGREVWCYQDEKGIWVIKKETE